jgi:hypothetical protein
VTAAFRTYIRGLWQREDPLTFEQVSIQPQPIALFQGESSEVIADIFDELGMPVDIHTGEWTAALRVKKQFDLSPAVVSLAGTVAAQLNRVVFAVSASALSGVVFGRYAYTVTLERTTPEARQIVVPPSLFEITPTIQ